MSSFLKSVIDEIKLYIRITNISEIARRYFVKNGMDGSLTALGIILGAWAVGTENPNLIVGAGLGACLAMGVSGLFGAYVTEKAERKRRLKSLEKSMLSKLEGTLHENASEFAPALAAIVDGTSPTLTALISLSPFFLTMNGMISIWDSYIISLVLTLMTLFALGLYLGRVAKENIWLYGLQMLAAGITILIIILAFERT
jgi:predicted membrane protein (TIGR00267 family)